MIAGSGLQQANSLRGMAMAAGNIVGPAIAGVLVVASSPGVALLIDAGSYGASTPERTAIDRTTFDHVHGEIASPRLRDDSDTNNAPRRRRDLPSVA